MKVREIYDSRLARLFLPTWVNGITLYPWILYTLPKSCISTKTRIHEWVHIEQVRRVGWLKFYASYLYYQLRYGYRNNPWEVEARALTEQRLQQESYLQFLNTRE